MSAIARDVRYAFRSLLKAKGFTLVTPKLVIGVVLGLGAACYVPARRAMRVDPMRALRSE